ncbi:phage baseplate assembly protein V [Serratia liquefaciens]|uniref:phage baseplate assembly protein V n=1 Tax=Serratia liquefaciens TaxID=614 RepID=UPI0021833C77|nr:phage baseplate assembly protein V [Serratia liquefaciens]CAI2485409.1 Phage P2 baseplate assembly protein gpV [Serratia liquefaciens]
MNTLETISELARAVRNLIRIGVIVDVDTVQARCRVQIGGNTSDWLQWLTCRAGGARAWWAPSIGEQVLLLALGGELDTAFVLPGIFSDDFPAPSASAEAYHVSFPDGAVIEYEPQTGALAVSGIVTADVSASTSVNVTAPTVTVNASKKINLNAPVVECSNQLVTGTIQIKEGGEMTGDLNHSGGSITSNGVVVHTHTHGGVETGGGQTDKPS